ncbi:MAG: restriction endonuclease subunit S [Candidatus Methanoperedens sp.]|nr:restriction endonuclease subunit S [Candidatus Methanoperedens sp.]CAG1005901.1 Type-1 restriction enzyme EcoKI specificity protein [Methanosarcinales archaeon]
MKKLPDGWKFVKLSDIANISAGGTPRRNVREYWNDGVIPWLKISDLKNTYINYAEEKINQKGLDDSSAKIFPKGTIVYSIFATLGAMGILEISAATNQAIAGIIPNNSLIDTKYLYHCLRSEKNNILAKKSHATQDNINLTILRNHEFPLPPLPTQKKIAAVLEKAEKLREWRKDADGLTDRFLKSMFLEIFGDPASNPKGWIVSNLEKELSDDTQNGLYKPATNYGNGVPILRIDSFYDGQISNIEKLKRLKCTKEEIKKFKLQIGDILINRVNSLEYLGKCGLVKFLIEDTVYESNMMRIRPKPEKLNPTFLATFLCTQYIKNQILGCAKKAVNQASINQKDVNSFKILVPPLPLQQKFASIAQQVEEVRAHQIRSRHHIENLFNVLMQRAFSGELEAK